MGYEKGMNQKNLLFKPPSWVAQSFIYQIFPDRFRKSGCVSDQRDLVLKDWGTDPMKQGFHGGDLYGVIESLDQIQKLGVTCIYLTPVFSSAANHRYHTYDYMKVDPILGGNEALHQLIETLHSRGMRIILDGVFNHCGRGFWAFHHVLENAENSPYKDWFQIQKWPLKPYPTNGEECGYSCWWNDPALPKFNHMHAPVRDYLISIACYWIEQGIDGWRLDVADEVPMVFWAEFRRRIKAINSEAWIVGEIWSDARKWLQGQHFDGVMNYRLGWSSISWASNNQLRAEYKNPLYPLKTINSEDFIEVLETTYSWYSSEVNKSQLNLLDSHDVPRALHSLKGDSKALKLALFLLFAQPGAPCIYYGTEIGLDGGAEPECREAFPWDKKCSLDLCEFIASLAELRINFPELSEIPLQWKVFSTDGLIACSSHQSPKEYEEIILIFNRSRRKWLAVPGYLNKPYFLLGSFAAKGKGLAPQSAVLFRSKILFPGGGQGYALAGT